jgi:hypothetical protein
VIVDVLEFYIDKYPDNEIFRKWVDDIAVAARSVYMEMGLSVR